MRILIADDEEVLRMLIVDTLEEEGHALTEAADGQEAIECFEKEVFDLLLVDYMMPRMTGIEVIRKVRETSAVNIVMLTAKTQQKDLEEAKEAGANFFLPKPFSPLKLIELIEELEKE
ncbi:MULTISPECIES: response regulator [Bacillaceae]|uniref:response regulator n=1 Tax=Bacillaceae TaxID=186817 RepID=UPI000E715256|nr:response regulator [Bacillus sp. PK3_68]RJS58749.1 response regulator [Bacillus sp. PK3_68]